VHNVRFKKTQSGKLETLAFTAAIMTSLSHDKQSAMAGSQAMAVKAMAVSQGNGKAGSRNVEGN